MIREAFPRAVYRLLCTTACSCALLDGSYALFAQEPASDNLPEADAAELIEYPLEVVGSSQTKPTAEIAAWISDLDASSFALRERATRWLGVSGKNAIEPLEGVVATGSAEASSRALAVLDQLHEPGIASPTRTAANAALKRLTKNADPTIARRADLVLHPLKVRPSDRIPRGMVRRVGANGRFGGGNIAFGANVAIGGGGFRMVQMQQAGGVTNLVVQEKNQKTTIVKQAGGAIRMTVERRNNGNITVSTYNAASPADLEKQNAEAFKIYKASGIENQAPALPAGNGPPVPAAAPPNAP